MSTSIDTLDIDLSDLEAARDEVATAIVDLVVMGLERPETKGDVTDLVFKLGAAHTTLVRAIDACGGPTLETP